MGLAKGLFVVDNHTYAQVEPTGYPGDEPEKMMLYHMDKYGVDMCVLKSVYTWGRSIDVNRNKLNADIVKRHPDRFVALCTDLEVQHKASTGVAEWTVEAANKEIDELMQTGLYVGIGESIPRDRNPRKKLISWDERFEQVCSSMDLFRKYKGPMLYITGGVIGNQTARSDITRNRAHPESCENGSPLLCLEIAALYPEVPIILAHGGVESSAYYMDDYEKCLYVAASCRNVFLDCGQWWTELYTKPLLDVNIGAEKILWGCGWGQGNLVQQRMPGQIPETYNVRNLTLGQNVAGKLWVTPKDTNDIWGWSLSQLGRLNIPQADMNLILGGNAAHLYNLKTPLPYEKMFRAVNRQYLDAEIPTL